MVMVIMIIKKVLKNPHPQVMGYLKILYDVLITLVSSLLDFLLLGVK